MKTSKKQISILAIAVVLIALCLFGYIFVLDKDENNTLDVFQKETIHLWYTDDALTDYLNSKAVSFYEANDIRVETKLVSGLEYLETVNKASVNKEEDASDIFIITNDSL